MGWQLEAPHSASQGATFIDCGIEGHRLIPCAFDLS